MFKIFTTPSHKLAAHSKKTVLWANIVKMNFASSILFWIMVLVLNILEITRKKDAWK